MKVIGVIGSPRKGQNTATLVEKVLEGAQSTGAETEAVYLGSMKIGPCLACDACQGTNRCVQKDDMQKVYDLLEESKALVLASPVYFDQVSAQTKIFIDRLYCYIDHSEANFPPGYKSVVGITYEDGHPTRYDYVLDWMKGRLEHYHRIDVIGSLKAASTVRQPVSQSADLLDEAFRLGVVLGRHAQDESPEAA